MDKLKPYIPFALRLGATIAAALAVLAAAKWDLGPDHLGEAGSAAVLAWTRWHPSASWKVVLAYLGINVGDAPELPTDTPPASGSNP